MQPFYVDDTFALEISDKPAWEVKHVIDEYNTNIHNNDDDDKVTKDMESVRTKRNTRRGNNNNNNNNNILYERPWECEAKIKWIDLGPDYFPRFLRTVECTRKKCWYNHYECQTRSFTVKLLRRRNGECVKTNEIHPVSNDELPGELKELWVWEERAVNFCCDCAASRTSSLRM